MDQTFVGLAEVQAQLYFRDLVGRLRDLDDAHARLVEAMTGLLKDYDRLVPRCKLRLYPRHRRDSFGPTALYWGNLFRLHPSSRGGGSKPAAMAIHHLKGPFDPRWVYLFAKRTDLMDRFLDFDRRRLALNAASRSVLRALGVLRKARPLNSSSGSSPILLPSGLDPGVRREISTLPPELVAYDLPPHLREALRAGWMYSFALAFYEEEFCHLGSEVQGNPSLDGLILVLERPRGSFYRKAFWNHPAAAKRIPKMTDRIMRELRVKQGARPVLALKELKRRRIARLEAVPGLALQSIREECAEAQVSVAKGLAQATGILLPGGEVVLVPVRAVV